jgi:ABC-type sugar transport system ATPase subunit
MLQANLACAADQDVTQQPVQERRIGFVFQSYALFNHMTVAENIAFGIRIRKLPIDSQARYPKQFQDATGREAPQSSGTPCVALVTLLC